MYVCCICSLVCIFYPAGWLSVCSLSGCLLCISLPSDCCSRIVWDGWGGSTEGRNGGLLIFLSFFYLSIHLLAMQSLYCYPSFCIDRADGCFPKLSVSTEYLPLTGRPLNTRNIASKNYPGHGWSRISHSCLHCSLVALQQINFCPFGFRAVDIVALTLSYGEKGRLRCPLTPVR